jgi:hypothetical protein
VTAADRVIRSLTAGTVVGVAAVAAVDGLVYASSTVMLDSARHRVPVPHRGVDNRTEGARLNDGHYRPTTATAATNRSLVAL